MSAVLEPLFRAGDRVRVRKAAPLGHVRTPFYIRGHAGVVERICGAFPNPEELAQQRDGLPAQPLYRVRFRQQVVPGDTLDLEVTLGRMSARAGKGHGRALVAGKVACEADLLFVLADL